MNTKRTTTLGAAMTVLFAAATCFAADEPESFSYDDYTAVLSQYVDEDGMVDYEGLKKSRQQLDAFHKAIAQLDPEQFEAWPDNDKIAFWINVYNSLTLQAIIDHYPIQSSFGKSLRFPRNSIRQIGGVWTKLKFDVMGREMSLEDIEHETLRKQFNEPRIHMALVCAAMGCPPLRNEPYLARRLDEQFGDQTRRFLANPEKFRIDTAGRRVYLSPIFKWFGDDFVPTYGTARPFGSNDYYSNKERATLNYIHQHLDKDDARRLVHRKEPQRVRYLDYDWTLNEQPRKKQEN